MPFRSEAKLTKSFYHAPWKHKSATPGQISQSDDIPELSENAAMSTPVVLVTGALTGIGRATAIAFAREGARVMVSGRHADAGETLTGELRLLGTEAEFVRADVRDDDDVRRLVDQTIARVGRLDVAVNSAGTEGKPGPLTEQTAETYASTFDTNVLGVVLSMKHELRVMQD